MFLGFEHTAIASPDPEKLGQWYAKHLGCHINHRYDGNVFVKAPNGAMLEIIPSEGPRASQGMKAPGFRHLAVLVDDFDAARQQLAREGVSFLAEPINIKGNRLVFFQDPDGNLVHLVHRETPLP